MNLSNYLSESGIKHSDFAREINVPAAMVYQWLKGIRPVAVKHCLRIESATRGLVTRRDLRPNDWESIWPELIDTPVTSRRSTDSAPPEAPDRPRRNLPDGKSIMSLGTDQPATYEVKK